MGRSLRCGWRMDAGGGIATEGWLGGDAEAEGFADLMVMAWWHGVCRQAKVMDTAPTFFHAGVMTRSNFLTLSLLTLGLPSLAFAAECDSSREFVFAL